MLKLFLPVVLLLTLFLTLCANSLAQTSSTVEVLYVAGPQGTSSVYLHTYDVNPQTAVASKVGSAIPVHSGSIDPLTIGTSHYIYLWNSNGVWLYPTNANGVPTSTASQHLTFAFAHPVYRFLVDPDGKFAYAAMVWTDTAGNSDASIRLFTINQSNGKLTNTNRIVASYSNAYIGFIDFLFGSQGGQLFAKYLDNGPYTTIFGFDYYPVNQTTGQLGKLQSLILCANQRLHDLMRGYGYERSFRAGQRLLRSRKWRPRGHAHIYWANNRMSVVNDILSRRCS
jgi:hypothetical protein